MSGGDTVANGLFTTLTAGVNFTLPTVDLTLPAFQIPDSPGTYAAVTKLTPADLTEGTVGGAGVFDQLMRGVKSHLEVEFKANRITGAEYTKAYIALVEQALQGAVQFLVNRDQSFWQATVAQTQAITARTQAETAKTELAIARYKAETSKAEYALTKMKLATESVQYDTGSYQLNFLLPAQKILLGEQMEAQRAQSADTRSDGAIVAGLLGKQKALYDQQIVSYQQDAKTKGAKIWSDAWTVMRTTDDATTPPAQFTDTPGNLNTVLSNLRTDLGI